MALSREGSISQYGTEAYTGWGETEAAADARAHPEKLNTYNRQQTQTQSAPTPEEYAKAIVDANQKQFDDETKWVDQYLADNPFAFDEQLARRSSEAEYLPYYSEMLKDYLVDVGEKRKTTQDEQKLLREIRTYDVGSRTRAYKYAVENAQTGYSGKGLFSSGMRYRDVGKQEIGFKEGMGEATARYETGERGLERTLTGYETEEQRQRRDIFGSEEQLGGLAGAELPTGERGGLYQAAYEGGVEQRRGEQYKQYYAPLSTAYSRRFPTSGGGVNQYLPAEYLRY